MNQRENRWTVGGGLEMRLYSDALFGVEYNYIDLSGDRFTAVTGGTTAGLPFHADISDIHTQTVVALQRSIRTQRLLPRRSAWQLPGRHGPKLSRPRHACQGPVVVWQARVPTRKSFGSGWSLAVVGITDRFQPGGGLACVARLGQRQLRHHAVGRAAMPVAGPRRDDDGMLGQQHLHGFALQLLGKRHLTRCGRGSLLNPSDQVKDTVLKHVTKDSRAHGVRGHLEGRAAAALADGGEKLRIL